MAYTSFKDLPIYFGAAAAAGSTTLPTEGTAANVVVHATQATFGYTPNVSQTRLLGQTPNKNNFALAGPPGATLSFSAYLQNGEFDPSTYEGTNGVAFRIGNDSEGIACKDAFLTSYSFTLVPYQPVLVNCEFQIFTPPTEDGHIVAMDSTTNDAPADTTINQYAHGAYSETSVGSNLTGPGNVESVAYSFSTQRLPIYSVNSTTVTAVEKVTAEQSATVTSDDIHSLVPVGGEIIDDFTIVLKNPAGDTILSKTVAGRMIAENVSITAGDLARGSMTITQPLL